MVLVKIDRDMLIEELYRLRASLPEESSEETRRQLDSLVNLIQNAPVSENKANYPRIRIGRG